MDERMYNEYPTCNPKYIKSAAETEKPIYIITTNIGAIF